MFGDGFRNFVPVLIHIIHLAAASRSAQERAGGIAITPAPKRRKKENPPAAVNRSGQKLWMTTFKARSSIPRDSLLGLVFVLYPLVLRSPRA